MKQQEYYVYNIRLHPGPDCVDPDPYDFYVGSTANLDKRLDEHRRGYRSRLLKKGYRLGEVRVLGPFRTRDEAERVEEEVADDMEDSGFNPWQH